MAKVQWVKANVPQFIGGGDSAMAQALLEKMPFAQATNMLMTMSRGVQQQLPEAPK